MAEEKNKKEEKNKDDCPLCHISPDTIAALRARAQNPEKKEEEKNRGLTPNK